MITKIAHLSDLHFGAKFDRGIWKSVKSEILRFEPNLIIVSGDLVDHPSPLHLLAAKGELRQLAADANAELVVVAGNHDVYESGVAVMQSRRDWFERVFDRTDTAEAERALTDRLGEPPGFSQKYQEQGFWTDAVKRWFSGDPFVALLPRVAEADRPKRVRQPDNVPVLLALLDSNAEDEKIRVATGSVAVDDLRALHDALKTIETPYLARIAVIHHHVLPIAFTGGDYVGAEPFMVLHNAGTVLSVLAGHRFDLALHGHQHRQQFARIDFDPRSVDGYPLAVASAGSAALESRFQTQANSFNLITIYENGRIRVTSLFYGDAAVPSQNEAESERVRTYLEPVSAVKRRAFIRARERHGMQTERWQRDFVVSEHGDLRITHVTDGLRLTAGDATYRRRPHDLFPPLHGRLVVPELHLDAQSTRARYKVELQPAADQATQRCVVLLPHSPSEGRTADYTLHHGYANSLTMTEWEARERWRKNNGDGEPAGDWNEEWVGTRITHPVNELVITLKLPPNLAAAKPYVACRRHGDFPRYEVDGYNDAVMPRDSWTDDDQDMQEEENQRLRFDPITRVWSVTIVQPMVGYNYQMRWPLLRDSIDQEIQDDVLAWREILLDATRLAAEQPQPPPQYQNALAAFDALRQAIETLLAAGDRAEKRGVELFVYDGSGLRLIPVFNYRSWTPDPLRADFDIALGDGIAGVAFQQRRTVPWSAASRLDPFIQPVGYPASAGEPAIKLRTMLAVPVYHPKMANEPHPPPWSAIGAVSFSSTAYNSKVSGMCADHWRPDSDERMTNVRGLAQTLVHSVRECLSAR
jgi:3',5'-cyclic AMP phosphodiesterase CpdA